MNQNRVPRSPYETLCASVGKHSARPFLRYVEGAAAVQDWSYADAARRVADLAAQYSGAGCSPGDRIALAADDSASVYLHLLAQNGLGLSLVPIDLKASDAEIRYLLDHSDSRLLVAPPAQSERLRQITAGIESCRLLTFEELAGCASKAASIVPGDRRREAALLYTSGTTGKPKGCMLTNEYFLTLGRWYNDLGGYCRLDPDDRLLTPLPPTHMNALCVSFMAMMVCGGCVIQLDRFHPSTWWQTVRAEGATIIHYLGVMPAILLSLAEDDDDFSKQVKFGFGAGVDPRHHARFEQRFGFPLLEAWAMTETGAGASVIADREPRHVGQRCFGRPPASLEYRLVDETDQDVAEGEPGELLVRRKGNEPRRGFFSGYYKDEAATREAWRGGWFHTGDVVRAGPDRSLYFVDRRKNVIRRSGENISAIEVEMALLTHADVANCAVTAVADELRGDEVFALLIPAAGSVADERTAEAVFGHCLEQLSYFKAPGYIAWVEKLPLTASQKVSRKDLKGLASELLEAGDCHDFRARKKRARTAG